MISKNIKSTLILILLLGVLVVFGGIFCYRAFSAEYLQIVDLIFGLFFLLPALSIIVIYTLPLNTRPLTQNDRKNISEFKSDVFQKDEKIALRPFVRVIFGMLSIIALVCSYYSFQNKNEILTKNDVKPINITLKEHPKTIGKFKDDLESLISNEYPTYSFNFGHYYSKILLKDSFQNKANIGDTINITIRLSDYKTKITKEAAPTFKSKYIDWKIIDVVGLKFKNKTYYDINGFKYYKAEEIHFWIWLLIIGLLGLCAAIFSK